MDSRSLWGLPLTLIAAMIVTDAYRAIQGGGDGIIAAFALLPLVLFAGVLFIQHLQHERLAA